MMNVSRRSRERARRVLAAAVPFVFAATLAAAAPPARPAPTECDLPPPADPQAADQQNQLCALQRMQDEYTNPAFFAEFWLRQTPRNYSDNVLDQAFEPTRPRVTLGQTIPGGRTTDPYRTPEDWERQGRGRVEEISIIAEDGAKLEGRIFSPNDAGANGKVPAVVITTGSIQGYQEMYNWAAEGLAEAGYMVLTYDVQGQGRSETFPHDADGSFACDASSCAGVPFQQGYNFYQGTRDALDFLFSTPAAPYGHGPEGSGGTNGEGTNAWNPLWQILDRDRVGIAGHSLGAGAVSVVGQFYRSADGKSVKAIVGWDALSKVTEVKDSSGAVVGYRDDLGATISALTVPGLSLTAEYFFNPTAGPVGEGNKLDAFNQLSGASVDTMRVALRSSTHLEFTYVPYILPASRYGERVAQYYTLAWFDRYLMGDVVRDGHTGTERLTALTFDGTADASSIGAGTYELPSVAYPLGRNVPNLIAGDCVSNRVSIYQTSKYALAGGLTDGNMRARGCP